jgi:hypothetical protein
MRLWMIVLALGFAVGCGEPGPDPAARSTAAEFESPAAEPAGEGSAPSAVAPPLPDVRPSGMNTYDVEGRLVGRDPAANTLTIEHGDVSTTIQAGTSTWQLRGVPAAAAPPDGTAVTAKLHDARGEVWLSEVRPRQ